MSAEPVDRTDPTVLPGPPPTPASGFLSVSDAIRAAARALPGGLPAPTPTPARGRPAVPFPSSAPAPEFDPAPAGDADEPDDDLEVGPAVTARTPADDGSHADDHGPDDDASAPPHAADPGVPAEVSAAVTRVDLVPDGPGDELTAHLTGAFAGLGDVPPAGPPAVAETAEALLRLFDAQAGSRWLDVAARRMRSVGVAHHTLACAGHEADAAVALALRADDPALLDHRAGAFFLARHALGRRTSRLSSGVGRGLLDVALGLAASTGDPATGGRHKAFGHPDLAVVPRTGDVAGHLPRAVGLAWTLGRQARLPERLRAELRWPDDAVVVATLSGAAANAAPAVAAVNAAAWTAFQNVPLPLLLVVEDDGLSRSGATPDGWVAAQFSGRPGLVYRYDDGRDPAASLRIAAEAARQAREERVPVVLHVRCVRLGGHAAGDDESTWRAPDRLAADRAADPVAATARALVAHGVLSPAEVRTRWASIRDEVAAAVEEALRSPRLEDADEVLAPLAPRRPAAVARRAARRAGAAERSRVFGRTLPEDEPPLTLAQSLNRTLLDVGARLPGLVVLGPDVARLGGPHGVTRGLQRRLGASRVLDTVLDEQTVLGMALGGAVAGLVPVAELGPVPRLADALGQLRGEAAPLAFTSRGAFTNPLVLRVPGLARAATAAGEPRDDLGLALLRDVPGLVVACPAHPKDAPAVLRTCLAAAETDGSVCVVVEPVALYHEHDLLVGGDGGWLARYAAPHEWEATHAPIGSAATWGDGEDLTIVTYGTGLRLALRAADRLATVGIGARVVDLRWLAPLPVADVLREARATGRCLVVDETRRSGSVSEAVVTELLEGGYRGRLARLTADDAFLPQGPAAELLLVTEDDVVTAAHDLLT